MAEVPRLLTLPVECVICQAAPGVPCKAVSAGRYSRGQVSLKASEVIHRPRLRAIVEWRQQMRSQR